MPPPSPQPEPPTGAGTLDYVLFAMAARLSRAGQVRDAAEAVILALQHAHAGSPSQRVAVAAFGHDGACRVVNARGLSDTWCAAAEGLCPWKEGEPRAHAVLISDAVTDPRLARWHDLLQREQVGSIAFVPLSTELGVVGMVVLCAQPAGGISAPQLRATEGVAAFAGVAIGRILAMRRLERSEARFRTMVEGTEVIVWEFDPARRVFTYVSPQASKFGYPLDQWLAPGFWEDHLHEDDRRGAVAFCEQEVVAGRNHRFQYRMRKADGSVVWVDDFVTVESLPGRPLVLRGVLVDITDRKQSEAALIEAHERADQANRAKSAFLANMSHEIRTPLTSILGYAELLREEDESSLSLQRRTEAIDTIQNAGQHLLTVINDILDLSKIEADRMTVEALPTQLTAVLSDVQTLLRPRAAARGVHLDASLRTALPRQIVSDPTRLRQILMNLAGNAVKFTSAGRVLITAAAVEGQHGQRLEIDVSDTGHGMTAEQAARIFAAFTQADASVTRLHGGTGLGLIISRRLAQLMGGDVTLLRTAPGEGSTFRLDLPLNAVGGSPMVDSLEHGAADATPAQSATALRGRVLLAEDGPDNQRLISHHLRRAGAQVDIAENGRIALLMIQRAAQPYDLLVTDIQMPEMDGYTLVSELRKAGSTLAVIALTAHAMADDRRRCTQAGCDAYASKPIDKNGLIAACSQWIGRPSAWRPQQAA